MASAFQVAKAYLELAAAGDEADPISNLRLQKLLYYAQGWSLALREKALFPERIEAWALGPVVPEVYHYLKPHGSGAVPAEAIFVGLIDEDEGLFVASVWGTYKVFSASKLSEMTHSEEPWRKARGNLAPSDASSEEITAESLRNYFLSRARKAKKS